MEDDKKVTFCLTSCNRFDLLQKTLDSFFNTNTYPIDKYIITEDSGNIDMKNKILDKYGDKIDLIFNNTNLGVYKSIDNMYEKVETNYIFHCEDDWLFENNKNFIKDSMDILEEKKDIHQIWIISEFIHPHAVEQKLFQTETKVNYKLIKANHGNGWCGFSNNPGLRRKNNYKDMFPNGYTEFYHPNMFSAYSEYKCNENAAKQGYRAAVLINHACKHIGIK